jgi:hypothetical protein
MKQQIKTKNKKKIKKIKNKKRKKKKKKIFMKALAQLLPQRILPIPSRLCLGALNEAIQNRLTSLEMSIFFFRERGVRFDIRCGTNLLYSKRHGAFSGAFLKKSLFFFVKKRDKKPAAPASLLWPGLTRFC